jgi:tetratricopeptide (TPR) repeat protein
MKRSRCAGSRPPDPVARADALFRKKKWVEAALAYRAALAVAGDRFETYNKLGICLENAGDLKAAAEVFLQGIARFHTSAVLYSNLGVVLHNLGHHDEAVHACETGAMLAPDDSRVLARLGGVLRKAGRLDEAAPVLERALTLDPGNLPALFAKGAIAFEQCRFDEALRLFTKVARADPNFKDALSNLGGTAMRMGDFEAGERWYRKACAQEPGSAVARWGLGMALLGRGAYAQGWELHESRVDCPALAGTFALLRAALARAPRWNGRPLSEGKLLIVSEQGLGDFIQFARYLPLAAQRAATAVRVQTPEPLIALMQAQSGTPWQGVEFFTGDAIDPEVRAADAIMSLPHRLAVPMDRDDPPASAYLRVPASRGAELAGRIAKATPEHPLRVGLVWAGHAGHINDRLRSLPFEALEPLLSLEGIAWYSLQKGGAETRLATHPLGTQMRELGSSMRDLADTAALLPQLDLLVSVDSAPVHLAAALGCPAWALIARAPDWRWLLESERTHWYESLRLWRQGPDGLWEPVIARVAEALGTLVRERRTQLQTQTEILECA